MCSENTHTKANTNTYNTRTHTQEIESNTEERTARKWSRTHADNQPQIISAAADLPHVHYMPLITASFVPELSTPDSDEVLRVNTHTSHVSSSLLSYSQSRFLENGVRKGSSWYLILSKMVHFAKCSLYGQVQLCGPL